MYHFKQSRDSDSLSSEKLRGFTLQISSGMTHLAQRNIVHHDIAARNIVLTDSFVCKIANFSFAAEVKLNKGT